MKNDLVAVALSYGIVFLSIGAYFVFMALRSSRLRRERAQLERRRAATAAEPSPSRAEASAAVADPVAVGS